MVETSDIDFKMAMQYYQSAQQLEKQGKIDRAFKFYQECAGKLVLLTRNCEHPVKKKEYSDMSKKALDQALWLKLQLDEQKSK